MTGDNKILDVIDVLKNVLNDVQRLKVEVKEMRTELNYIYKMVLISYVCEEIEKDEVSKQMDMLFECVYWYRRKKKWTKKNYI